MIRFLHQQEKHSDGRNRLRQASANHAMLNPVFYGPHHTDKQDSAHDNR